MFFFDVIHFKQKKEKKKVLDTTKLTKNLLSFSVVYLFIVVHAKTFFLNAIIRKANFVNKKKKQASISLVFSFFSKSVYTKKRKVTLSFAKLVCSFESPLRLLFC